MQLDLDNGILGHEQIGGFAIWHLADGTTRSLPVVSGGDGTTSTDAGKGGAEGSGAGAGGGTGEGAGTGSGASTDADKRFSQEDLNRIAAAQKAEGERAAERRLLESLGVGKLDDAKAVLDRSREAERAAMTEAERAKAEAEEAKRAADADRAAAAADRRDAAVERALLGAGLALPEGSDATADTARKKVLSRAVRLVDIEGEPTPEAVAAAVTDLKATMPALFGTNTTNGAGGTGGGRPASGNPSGSSNPPLNRDTESEGAKRAAARWAKHNQQNAKIGA